MKHIYIVVGPINDEWHVCYRVPGTNTWSSICVGPSEASIQEEANLLNKVNSDLGACLVKLEK